MARKRISQKPRETILVVTATEAEALYFSQMRKDCRYSNMTVVWQETFNDLHQLIGMVARMRTTGSYTSAWLVFGLADLGIGVSDVKEEMEYAERRKVKLGWNNPSLPLWYLLHMQAPRAFVSDPKIIEGALAKQLPSFRSDASYLLDEGMDLHLRLYSAKSKAAVNASTYNMTVEPTLGLGATNMIALLNDITEICGLADLSHNQKQLGMKRNNG
ncbi:MAG TPA: RloB domain-containing protein [Sphaerochaeta sp.]|jgi:hypothetical protein|nr:RloB domain-containing protein [Sphaerochaeta sp.]HPZ15998.1 RloB domain-containing protein [Sphaerochaeta sp.]